MATPHRGSSAAFFLDNLLQALNFNSAKHRREYVAELSRDSSTLDTINDEFRHYTSTIQLFSFYETVPMNLGPKSCMIVEKNSSLLG